MALAIIVAIGAAMRLWLMLRWRPAFVGFPDTVVYIIDAKQGLFADPLRISGYALFLRLLHAISPHLSLVPLAQHGLGLASGVLIFDAMRRARLPIGLGLVPAAVVILGGSELFLEHAPLTESPFIFLVVLALWCVVRAWTGSGWWALPAGVCLGCATIDRTVGEALLPVAVACLLMTPAASVGDRARRPLAALAGVRRWLGRRPLAALAGVRRWLGRHPLAVGRATRVALATAGAFAVIVPFLYAHEQQAGGFEFTSNAYLDFYARVAPWVDCRKFTPPKGTARLCPTMPVSQRPGNGVWEFTGLSPALAVYGAPEWFGPKPPRNENSQLKAFALAAIKAQPLRYLEWVGRDLLRIVDPNFPTSPYKAIGNNSYGFTPEQQLDYYFDMSNIANIENIITSYYPQSRGGVHRSVRPLVEWERATRLQGPAMVLALLLALLAPFLARGMGRRMAITCGLFTVVILVAPVLGAHYEYRFVIPAFGFLTAGSAIGAYEVARRCSEAQRRLRGRHRRAHGHGAA